MPNNQTIARADATFRYGLPPDDACGLGVPMAASAIDRLSGWFSGQIALTTSEAHRLLENAIESGKMVQRRGEFVAAIKALVAGPRNWHDMGYRLILDD